MVQHEKTDKNPNGAGRPLKEIDWEKAKNLAIAGCSGVEIASHFDLCHQTFYDRCQKDLGMKFTEFLAKYREKGESMLRAQQFAKAMGHTDKGDNTLLIWLGKCRLKQTEDQNLNQKITVNVIDYSDDTPQVQAEGLSTGSAESF